MGRLYQRFGVEFNQGYSGGALSYTINALTPSTTYYFRVRGGNGCMPGDWGNELKVTTARKGTIGGISYYRSFLSRAINTLFPKKVTPLVAANQTPQISNNSCIYIVQPGDSLSKIAKKVLGDAHAYPSIKVGNQSTYPSLKSSNTIRTGWKLQIGC